MSDLEAGDECPVHGCTWPIHPDEFRCWRHAGGSLRDDMPDEPLWRSDDE
ncbi:hypothetical protein [Natrinema sp. DC36]|nr:hypothetical protein [Natrinema sp. DC36]